MYWFRTDNPGMIGIWLAFAALWTLGGWLLATHAFRLEARERLLVGFGLGLVGYIGFTNWLGHWLPPDWTYTGAALAVFAVGVAFAWKGERPWLDRRDLGAWRWLVVGLVLTLVFARLARGLAIFDDRKNLSIVSTMAAGDIPPHHYMNAAVYFPYHYGFQLVGASLMRLGGLMPWSAFDLSKALVGAYTLLLAALLGKRASDHPMAGPAVAGALAFSTGTRYLLLLLPADWLERLDPLIFVRSPDEVVGLTLSQALVRGVTLPDGPPAPFPYAFMNGIGWPAVMAIHAGPSTMALAILLLAWLLIPRMKRPAAWVLLALLFAVWALVWESSFGLFWLAGLGTIAVWLWLKRGQAHDQVRWVGLALAAALPLALVQGGTVTETIRTLLNGSVQLPGDETAAIAGFSLRWPPAIYSGHLSALSILSVRQLLVGLCEVGPVVLLTPWITRWVWQRFRHADGLADWTSGALMASAWLGFLLPMFFSYEYDRDIVRFSKYGLLVWTIFLTILWLEQSSGRGKFLRLAAGTALGLMVFGGVVVFGTEWTAAGQSVLSETGVSELDARLIAAVWDQLPDESQVFDPQTWRATMVTGRLTRVVAGNMSYNYEQAVEWEQLRANPMVEQLLAGGFQYVYVDEIWWADIPDSGRAALSQDCVQVVAEVSDSKKKEGEPLHFRRLVNLGYCRP